MNNKDEQTDDYRSLQLLDEISRNHELTQRDLSRKLGVALGLINSYLKNLAAKGYITISTIPRKRYAYYLTPHGFAEKTRLTYRHLQNFTALYRVARRDFSALFTRLAASGVKRVAFSGVDEVTEIAYLSLKDTDLELTGIVDSEPAKQRFLGHEVRAVADIKSIPFDVVVITNFKDDEALRKGLVRAGVDEKKVLSISSGGWLKKIEGPAA
ncbi:MAG: winged helix-turn-helix transcriptional regulator [Thermodesulfobacteriota bacterium]|nr:MAG: winged helix-turn-helix transcriptional regulator [Thermodesulfobacteriota bacterium]